MRFIFRLFATSLLTLTVSLAFGGVAVWGNPQPWKLSYVYRFKTQNGGRSPTSALVADAQGALYGATTNGGGQTDNGTIYKLTPSGNGYAFHVIHAFHSGDGQFPNGPLIVDKTGAVFGTTSYGGLHATPGDPGFGLVFKLTPSPHGYIESFLHSFNGGDGRNPSGGLVMDATGSLYGVTAHGGGAGSDGTAYKLTPTPTGYAETVLHRFALGREGHRPFGELALDRFGSIYGVTNGFSVNESIRGTVYKLTPVANGYSERTLYGFVDPQRGASPGGSVIIDSTGALYGTTTYGGADNVGVVYKLNPTPSGYAETVIFSFAKTGTSGELPMSTLMMDASG
ncbi:MAG: hypothetical protein IAI50_18710, partial [Candidatus Eremiobacteraeota bacterium]|nr:hypothetical protein [Candidatus Eremiobacteraeota bacterium]